MGNLILLPHRTNTIVTHFRVRIRLKAVCLVACFRLNQEKLEITPKLYLWQRIKQ